MVERWLVICGVLMLAGCFWGEEVEWASHSQIVEAAKRCGVDDFEPGEAGSHYAAHVSPRVPNAREKEDCIYRDLKGQGLLVTR